MEVIKRFGDKVSPATSLPPSPVLTEGAMITYAPKWIRHHERSANGMDRPCSRPTSSRMLGRGAKDKEHAMTQTFNAAVSVVGIDIGKNSFHIVGHDERGAIVLRQKWSRGQMEARFANMPRCLVGMEACVGAHHLSRKLNSLGHDARLMPAKYVRPYSKGQKNDFRDAEAIAEAVQRPTMKFVATKTADQLDLQALHRVRERLVSQRTGIINQIRAFLLERGIAVRQGQRFLRAELPRILATPPDVLSPRMVRIIEDLACDWRRLDERVERLSDEIEAIARQDAGCERLMSVPGIGPIISSAMVAAIGAGDVFNKGRDFAAWLGLVPKQISTGDRTILGKISRRGNRYLRVLFVQAAWVVLIKPKIWERHGLKPWIEAAKKRLHHNVLAIALANKLARIAWSVLARGRAFEARKLDQAANQSA
jgi:transposase